MSIFMNKEKRIQKKIDEVADFLDYLKSARVETKGKVYADLWEGMLPEIANKMASFMEREAEEWRKIAIAASR